MWFSGPPDRIMKPLLMRRAGRGMGSRASSSALDLFFNHLSPACAGPHNDLHRLPPTALKRATSLGQESAQTPSALLLCRARRGSLSSSPACAGKKGGEEKASTKEEERKERRPFKGHSLIYRKDGACRTVYRTMDPLGRLSV